MKDSQKLKKKKRLFKKKSETPKKLKKSGVLFDVTKKRQSFPRFNFKKNETNFQLILIPLILLSVFGIINILNTRTQNTIAKNKLVSTKEQNIQPLPVITSDYLPVVTAKTAIVQESASQTILFSKNKDLRFSMASTVKIMTALVALDHYQPDSILTIKSSGIEGSILGLQKGDKFYFQDILYAMLLPSANDAAVAIVDNYPGGREIFISDMNAKAKLLNLKNTKFSEPTGLNDDENFTTVVDLARLASFAMKDKKFAQVVGTQQKFISNQSKTKQYFIENLNKLLGTNGVNGVKTGTTEGAGEVLVTSAVINDHSYIIIVMNSQDRFFDTTILLDYISGNVIFVEPTAPL